MRAGVVADRGPAIHPADRADEAVEGEADDQREDRQQERDIVQRAPERQLGDVEPEVVTEDRLADAVAQPFPRERHGRPPRRAAAAGEEAEEESAAHRDREQQVGGDRLADLEVGYVPRDLHRADRAVDHEEVADEPRGRDENAAGLQRAAEQVPAGEERDGGGRDLAGPPAVGQQLRRPPPGEQEPAERDERDDEPPGARRHSATRSRLARRASS